VLGYRLRVALALVASVFLLRYKLSSAWLVRGWAGAGLLKLQF